MKRFYFTLILYKLLKEHTVWEVAGVFKVARGFVQNLLTSTSSFASCMVHFTGVSTRMNIKYTLERVSGSPNQNQSFGLDTKDTGNPVNKSKLEAIALFTVNFSHLHDSIIQHGCEAISG